MKTLYFFLLILTAIISCKPKEIDVFEGAPGPNKGDTSVYNEKNYRLTKILNFSASDSKDPYSYVEFTYDSRGNLVRESMIDVPDLLSMYKTYTYENGRMATQKVFDGVVNRPTLSRTITYTYQGDLVSQEDAVGTDGEIQQSVYFIRENRKLLETYTLSKSLGKHHDYKYTYDSRGNATKQQAYMYNNELEWTENYIYDAQNRRIKTERFNYQNLPESIAHIEYVGNNILPSVEIFLDAQGKEIQHINYDLDVAGNQIQTLFRDKVASKRKYYGKLLREEIRYSPQWGFAEFGMTRYEYEKR